jgi:hypothetical protein
MLSGPGFWPVADAAARFAVEVPPASVSLRALRVAPDGVQAQGNRSLCRPAKSGSAWICIRLIREPRNSNTLQKRPSLRASAGNGVPPSPRRTARHAAARDPGGGSERLPVEGPAGPVRPLRIPGIILTAM